MEIAEYDAPPWSEHTVYIIERLFDQLVVQIVDQSDAVDEMLRWKLEFSPSQDERYQVLVPQCNLSCESLLRAEFVHVGECLDVDVKQGHAQASLVVDPGVGVEDLRRRAAGQAQDIDRTCW